MDIKKVTNWFRARNAADLRSNEAAEEMTQLKLMKLLYLAQGVSLAAYGTPIFPDPIVAWKLGPAIDSVHHRFAGKREIVGEITDQDRQDYEEVESNPEVSAVLNAVYETYGGMSASDLVNFTHKQDPWIETNQSGVIDPDSMKDYFQKNILTNEK